MRGKSASPLCTRLPGTAAPKRCTESQVLSASSVTPVCSKMRAGVRGMKGPTSTATMRLASSRLYSTVPRRGRSASLRARIQGVVWSM